MKTCFIIMPISTPKESQQIYGQDPDHFEHVLQTIFIPAVKAAGLEPIPPKATGSDVIQAEIIKNLSTADLVLCDMSNLNSNVFFEFGIRTALDKVVALVTDDITKPKIPFDTSIINYVTYDHSLRGWLIQKEVDALCKHIQEALGKGPRNSLWKYFGVAQPGVFKPEDVTVGEKVDLLMRKVEELQKEGRRTVSHLKAPDPLNSFLIDIDEEHGIPSDVFTPADYPQSPEWKALEKFLSISRRHKDIKQSGGLNTNVPNPPPAPRE